MLRFLLFVLIITLNPILTFSQSLSQNLIAYYPFNGNANDESGNSFNGQVSSATLTTDRFNNTNSAYSFDGIDDYIKIAYNQALDLSDSLTISCWILGANLGSTSEYSIISKLGNGIVGYDMNVSYKRLQFQTTSGGIPSGYANSTIPIINFNNDQWYQVAVVFSIKTQKLQFYIDGQLYQEFARTESISKSVGSDLYIGHRELSGISNYFPGKIDDVRLYNRPLTAEQVKVLYSTELYPVTTWIHTPNQASSINIYPNPISESVTISFDESSETTLKVFDSKGGLIYFSVISNGLVVDSKNWTPGIYYFQVIKGDNLNNAKIIKE